ncbi:MAG: metallopeptidase family protein [Actinomycetota bacterium]
MADGSVSFEELVTEALDSLPPDIAGMMNNVEVIVEDEPPVHQLQRLPRGHTLFGLYEGIPLTKRGIYDRALPDRITIYRGPITRSARSSAAIRAQVRKTVIHEIGHHFGIEEHRLHELGWG